ncbi:hypothetical protein V6N12_076490 [Hibiscus sabdariffa]|uniref:Disease resistance N-terminal domain-containing protein n=1 Tax=Hibiscus sabdariffa TaxID=183260 RepID=A0ABR2D9Y7_9ROSI
MAESFLASITAVVLEKLAPHIGNGVSSVLLVNSELRKLRDSVIRIQAVLSDAERQQHQNKKLRLCMWKLRDLFYDAKDVIDCFKCEDLRKQVSRNPDLRIWDQWAAKRFHADMFFTKILTLLFTLGMSLVDMRRKGRLLIF